MQNVQNNLNLSDRRFGYILAAPSVLIVTLIILFPITFALISSFFDYTLINKSFNNSSPSILIFNRFSMGTITSLKVISE